MAWSKRRSKKASCLATDLSTLKVRTKLKPTGKRKTQAEEAEDSDENDEELDYPTPTNLEKELERVKWYLWHGNVLKALQVLGDVAMDLEGCELDKSPKAKTYQKIWKRVREFSGYIQANQPYVVNYGDR